MFMGEEGKQTGCFSHVAIPSGASDHRSDLLIFNFSGRSKLHL